MFHDTKKRIIKSRLKVHKVVSSRGLTYNLCGKPKSLHGDEYMQTTQWEDVTCVSCKTKMAPKWSAG